jgi:hypothetical protein
VLIELKPEKRTRSDLCSLIWVFKHGLSQYGKNIDCLRTKFGAKGVLVTGGCRKLYNEHIICSPQQKQRDDQTRDEEISKASNTYRTERNAYNILVGKSDGKILFEELGIDRRIILR